MRLRMRLLPSSIISENIYFALVNTRHIMGSGMETREILRRSLKMF